MEEQSLYRFFNAIGIFDHYLNLSQGVIALKDMVYFICSNYIVLYVSKWRLYKIKNIEGWKIKFEGLKTFSYRYC